MRRMLLPLPCLPLSLFPPADDRGRGHGSAAAESSPPRGRPLPRAASLRSPTGPPGRHTLRAVHPRQRLKVTSTRIARTPSSRFPSVQCRFEGRAQRQDRLRPSVRASDVQRLRKRHGDYFEPLREIAATDFTAPPGSTHNYFQTVPRPALDTALFLESDRMAICSARSTRPADNQIGVVQNEKRQGDNGPTAWSNMPTRALSPRATLSHSTIGSMADLDSAASTM